MGEGVGSGVVRSFVQRCCYYIMSKGRRSIIRNAIQWLIFNVANRNAAKCLSQRVIALLIQNATSRVTNEKIISIRVQAINRR